MLRPGTAEAPAVRSLFEIWLRREVAVLTGRITIEFGQRELRASVAETDLALKATPSGEMMASPP